VRVRLTLSEANALSEAALRQLGYDKSDARAATGHLIDAELRGLGYAGFGRLASIAEQIKMRGYSPKKIEIVRETSVSARINGGDHLGLVVAQRATDIAIGKAVASGIAIVGAADTWYTGMLSYYAERAVERDLVVMIASNGTPRVAPYGGTERRYGTNPICFGFPSADQPVVWDISTSALNHAAVMLDHRLGRSLAEGQAFTVDGTPTTNPAEAMVGAFAAWGGHRGSGLGVVVQFLGMLAGSAMMPGELRDFGFLILTMRPDLLTSLDDFKTKVANYSKMIRATRPVEGGERLRMPFDRSRAEREKRLARGFIDVPDLIHAAITAIAKG
jgi:delta1-piperideine-2-carboxylate reductase